MGPRLNPFQGVGRGRLPCEKVGSAGQIYFFKRKISTWRFPWSEGKKNLANVLQAQIFLPIFKHEQILLKMFLAVRAHRKPAGGRAWHVALPSASGEELREFWQMESENRWWRIFH